MSAIRLTAPRRVASPAPRALQAAEPTKARLRMFSIAKVVFFGFVITQIAQLILGITVTQSAYELKALKVEKAELTTQSQIVGQQVDSLSSQQNLANAAAELGMIANANPVFLQIADQKVFGKPKAALNSAGRVSRNNIASAALVERSVLTAGVASANMGNVAQGSMLGQPVAFSTETIPVSPTH